MAEKKLSEELRHCLDIDHCVNCDYHEPDTILTCRSLMEKAYEVVRQYEEMEDRKNGKIDFCR